MKVVYFIRCGKAGPVKIGWTSNLKKRLLAISQGLPDHAILEATLPGGRELEKRLHGALNSSHRRAEWFNPTDQVNAVISLANLKGVEAIERWLERYEASIEVRAAPDFQPTDDFDADARWLMAFAFQSARKRYGLGKLAELLGRSDDQVSKYCRGISLPSVVMMHRLMEIDPGGLAPFYARCGDVPEWMLEAAYDAIGAQLGKLKAVAA